MAGILGKGTTLTIGSAIANIISAGFVEGQLGKEEVTTMDTEGTTEEYIPGMGTPGETEFTALYTKANFAAVDGLFGTLTEAIVLALPDGASQSSAGWVSSRPSGPIEIKNKIVFKFRVQWSGEPTYTPGT